MPALEEMDLWQFAVLWAIQSGRSAYNEYGELQTDAPVDVHVRWVEGQTDAMRPDGTPVRLDGKITTDETIAIGSLMWLAPDEDSPALDQYYESGSAGEDVELMVVEALMGRARSICGKFTRREYGLAKYRSTSPQGA